MSRNWRDGRRIRIFGHGTLSGARPTLQQFFLCMTVPKPYSREGTKRAPGDLAGVRFENITLAAASVLGEPQLLWGQPDARIHDLVFDNLTLAGEPVRNAGFFRANEHVDRLVFLPRDTPKP